MKQETAFDMFWALYPRKTGKQEARIVWDNKKLKKETIELIMIAVIKQSIFGCQLNPTSGKQFIMEPRRWLLRERWEDEIITEEQDTELQISEGFTEKEAKELLGD